MSRSHAEEEAAAQAVQRVLGGTWVLHDTGSRAGQVDVLHELDDGQRVALEVTSFGTHEQSKTRDAIQKRTEGRGGFAGASLSGMWQILVAKRRLPLRRRHKARETTLAWASAPQ